MSDAELEQWARAHPHMPQAVAVLRLLAEKAALQRQIEGHVARIAEQSELLSRKAEGKS